MLCAERTAKRGKKKVYNARNDFLEPDSKKEKGTNPQILCGILPCARAFLFSNAMKEKDVSFCEYTSVMQGVCRKFL